MERFLNLSEKYFFLLKGKWNLNRSINDHGHMKGIATFSPFCMNPLALFYREEGEHILQNGVAFSFFKEYIYCLNQKYIDVYFSYNTKRSALFHKLLFEEAFESCLATGEHGCGKDTYKAIYQFFGLNTFTLQYDIRGPKKNLRIHTLFQRQSCIT